jgi:ribosomal protein L17
MTHLKTRNTNRNILSHLFKTGNMVTTANRYNVTKQRVEQIVKQYKVKGAWNLIKNDVKLTKLEQKMGALLKQYRAVGEKRK